MSRSLKEPVTLTNEVLVLAGASRIVFALVNPLISFVGLRLRFFASCSMRRESRIAEAAGSISQISAMIFRAFSRVRIAIIELGGICGIIVSMYNPYREIRCAGSMSKLGAIWTDVASSLKNWSRLLEIWECRSK